MGDNFQMKNGWTFIETLAVLAIVGILVAVAVPGIRKTIEADKKKEIQRQEELAKVVRQLVNESIISFEMPEEELQSKSAEVENPQSSPEYFVYYVSYFFDSRQGAAEVSMTRQITCWADLYTTDDCILAKIKDASAPGEIKSAIITQYTLMRHIPAQGTQ
jgi:prepilin-type N-terminal cleavage/methylation domain-containing protein